MTEFEALKIIAAHDGESPQAVRAAFLAAGLADDRRYRDRMMQLQDDEYIDGSADMVVLTSRGLDYIDRHEKTEAEASQQAKQAAEQEAKEERKWYADHKVAIAAILVAPVLAALKPIVVAVGLVAVLLFDVLRNRVKNRVK